MIVIRVFVIGAQACYQLSRFFVLATGALLLRPMRGREACRDRLHRAQAVTLLDFLRNLGATWIKIGQILSARPDLLPPHIIARLETLQDDVPAESFAAIRDVVESELGAPLERSFAAFDPEPVAAASVAQVHKGQLHSGETVAVKVQRPGIEARMDRDLSIIQGGAKVLHVIPGLRNLSIPRLAAEFAKAIKLQLDFAAERAHNRRFAANFADTAWVRVPALYPDFCSDRVITMAWIDGQRFRAAIEDPPLERNILAKRILNIYFAMAFRDKFMHADLHPGNIMVDADGNFVLLDLGLVYEVPVAYIRKFIRVLTAATIFDGRGMAEAYLEGTDVSGKDVEQMLQDAENLTKKYVGLSYSEMEVSEVTLEIFGLLRRHRVYLDAEWTGFILAEVTFEGIAKMMDQGLDLLTFFTQNLPTYLQMSGALDTDDPLLAKADAAAAAI